MVLACYGVVPTEIFYVSADDWVGQLLFFFVSVYHIYYHHFASAWIK